MNFIIAFDGSIEVKLTKKFMMNFTKKQKTQLDDLGVELVDVHLDPEGDNGAGSGDKNDDPTEGPSTSRIRKKRT